MRCGTLFSGGGGVEIGLEMLGYECRWGVENNPAIADVYEENFPSSILHRKGVEDCHVNDFKPVDLIHISPPCQKFSTVHHKNIDDPISLLVLPIVKKIKPFLVTLENVPLFLHSNTFKELVKELEKIKYKIIYNVENMSEYGLPQDRRRLFVIASKGNIVLKTKEFKKVGWYESVNDIMRGLEPSILLPWQLSAINEIKRKKYPYLISRIGANTKSVKPRSYDMQSPTIRAFQNSWGHEWANVVTSSKKSWKVSIDMTYRLSSFPKKYKKPKDEKLAQVIAGNAVPPVFMKNILERICYQKN